MLIDGKKWACESCIKGHRVSSCTHKDRPLKEIAPKGRPVKQCEHCRGARKAKSHHAKCDCGDKKDKLAKHNLSGDLFGQLDADGVRLAMDELNCVCYQGTTCTCGGIKREPADPSIPPLTPALKNRPKLTSAQSENLLMNVTNGQHRPCHRLNNAAHVSGAPYRIPRAFHSQNRPGHNRTISIDTAQQSRQMSSAYDALFAGASSNGIPLPGQATVDDMHLLGMNPSGLYGNLAQRSVDNLSSLYTSPAEQFLTMPTSVPISAPTSAPNPNLPYLSAVPFTQSVPTNINNTADSRAQNTWMSQAISPTVSATYSGETGIASPASDWGNLGEVDWSATLAGLDTSFSAGDLPLDVNKFSSPPMPPPSNSGESYHNSACGVSSGPRSEAGEFGFLNELGTEWPSLEPSSTNASEPQSLFDLTGAVPWSAQSPNSDNDEDQDIEFYRSDTIKPPKPQPQPIGLVIPSSVSPQSHTADTPSQYASAAASGQTSPVVFEDAWTSQPASATSYTFADNNFKTEIDPLSLTNSLQQVQNVDQDIDWDALLRGQSGGMYNNSLQGFDSTSLQQSQPQVNLAPNMMDAQTNMWLPNQQ